MKTFDLLLSFASWGYPSCAMLYESLTTKAEEKYGDCWDPPEIPFYLNLGPLYKLYLSLPLSLIKTISLFLSVAYENNFFLSLSHNYMSLTYKNYK